MLFISEASGFVLQISENNLKISSYNNPKGVISLFCHECFYSLFEALIFLCLKSLLSKFFYIITYRLLSFANLVEALCTFIYFLIKSKLYSSICNPSFSTYGMAYILKQDRGGNIDGVLYHSWLRHKKNEFMEALGLPTSRRQNRGLKL